MKILEPLFKKDALAKLERNTDYIEVIRQMDFTKPQVFFMGAEPLRIDFLTKVNIVNFDDVWKKDAIGL